jgi:hypothetical protein
MLKPEAQVQVTRLTLPAEVLVIHLVTQVHRMQKAAELVPVILPVMTDQAQVEP